MTTLIKFMRYLNEQDEDALESDKEDTEATEPMDVEGEGDVEGGEPTDDTTDDTEMTGEELEEVDPEEQLSDIEKVYKLKKLYAKLLSISKILEHYTEPEFEDVQKKIFEALDIFQVVIDHYDLFRPKIDAIISSFEKLLKVAVKDIEKYVKKGDK